MMTKVVDINEFVSYLKANDLVIVSASEFQANKQVELNVLRARLLKKKAVSVNEVVQGKLLPYSTKQGVRHWMERERLVKNEDWYQESQGKKRVMILTDVIKKYHEIL